jgi:hypothetical protein
MRALQSIHQETHLRKIFTKSKYLTAAVPSVLHATWIDESIHTVRGLSKRRPKRKGDPDFFNGKDVR